MINRIAESLIPYLGSSDAVSQGQGLECEPIVDFYHTSMLTFLAELLRDCLQKSLLDLGLGVIGVFVLPPDLILQICRQELIEKYEGRMVLAIKRVADIDYLLGEQISLDTPILSQF